MTSYFFVQSGRYMDSVSLMQIARTVRENTGAEDVALIMGTDANKKLMEQVAPLSSEALAAKPSDLIILIKATEADIEAAKSALEKLLNANVAINSQNSQRAISNLRTAIRQSPEANIVLISLAADYAVEQAWQALSQGCHVFMFSDNVSLEDEKALKSYARQKNLLMMGPGAGTAIINQVGFGFSNVVLKGKVGIVSASGTGLQEVSTLLAKQGIGISQAIGVGSRDLSEYIGGLMSFQAIEALKADPQTEVILLISKMPAPTVAQEILATLETCGKPCVVIFMTPALFPSTANVFIAEHLQAAALAVTSILQGQNRQALQETLQNQEDELRALARRLKTRLQAQQAYLRGLFTGGTLCEEAMRLCLPYLGEIWSNIAFDSQWQLSNALQSIGHSFLDLGDEEFTVGRPHPMIDSELRVKRLMAEAQDAEVAIIQIDLVIGYGAHENPAKDIAQAIQTACAIANEAQREIIFIACIVGTLADPQDFAQQKHLLESVGVMVMNSNAEASLLSAFILGESYERSLI